MINPNKYVRIALINVLSAATSISFYDTMLPRDVTPVPSSYGIIYNQTMSRYDVGKANHDWLCGVNIDLYDIGDLGSNNSDTIDDMEEDVLKALENGVDVNGFVVQAVSFLKSETVNSQSDTNSINPV